MREYGGILKLNFFLRSDSVSKSCLLRHSYHSRCLFVMTCIVTVQSQLRGALPLPPMIFL